MVKKISGPTSGTSKIQSTKAVEATKVAGINQVKQAEKTARATSVRGAVGSITPEQKQKILQYVDEEADKLFGKDGLPESKKSTIKEAVRMAIESVAMDEE